MKNLITDVPGLSVGVASDARLASGVSAVLFDEPASGGMAALGGAPALLVPPRGGGGGGGGGAPRRRCATARCCRPR
jgi:hypothetical protein